MSSRTAIIEAPPQTLREAMAQARLSNDQIMARTGCSRKSLTNWRSGQRPNDYFIGKLSEALGFDLWSLYATEHPSHITLPAPAILPAPPVSHWSLNELIIPRSPGHIDSAMQHYLVQQLAHLWDAFHMTDDLASITTQRIALGGHVQTLESLAAWPIPDAERKWLTGAMSDAAILAGRIARDQINFDEAIAQHKRALQLAIESGSHDHIAAATMRLAETLWDAGLPYEAVGYCRAGIEHSRGANPRIRGELLGLAAEIYGVIGDIATSERLMHEAAALAVGAANLPTIGGIRFSETAAASYQMDEALRRGDTSTALAHIERARKLLVIEFPISHNTRWEAHLWINQARAHSAAHEIEAACDDLRRAAHLAQSIASQIALRKVQDAARSLTQYQRQPIPAVQALNEELIHLSAPRRTL